MKKIFMLMLSACCAFLVACGGGGDSGAGSTEPPAQPFSATGTWSAMGAGGIYNITLDETAGTLSYLRPDEDTGVTVSTTLAGMTRGADGAYIFTTGLSVGGQPLNVTLYRVDNNTLAGQLLSSLRGVLKLVPVMASRKVVQDFSQISGDWSGSIFSCGDSLNNIPCQIDSNPPFRARAASAVINSMKLTACNIENVPMSACAPADVYTTPSLIQVGAGVYTTGDVDNEELFQAFTVAGNNLVFFHNRGIERGAVYFGAALLAPEIPLTPEMLNGTWRASTADGRNGNVTINNTAVTAYIAGLPQTTGSINYNKPWNGLAQATIGNDGGTYYVAGNSKLLFISGDFGFYLLHRE